MREVSQLKLSEPAGYPLKTLAASRHVTIAIDDPSQRQLLERVLHQADVGLCGYSATFRVEALLESDFRVEPAGDILLSQRIFSCPSAFRLHVRHAIELMLWTQLCSPQTDPARALAVSLLSALTTTRFYQQMPTSERKRAADSLPDWLKGCIEIADTLTEEDLLQELASKLRLLMPLQGHDFANFEKIEEGIAIARGYTQIAKATEWILTQQGDERLLIDPATGLNKYGCSPRPRPEAITFSSCTASSVSEYAYREAEMLRHRLMQTLPSGDIAQAYEIEMEKVRTELMQLLDLDSLGTEVILASSGTDAELYPLVLFRSENEKLVNIVVAPDEVGSGTVHAAGGRHFGTRTPLGANVRQGETLTGLEADSVDVVCIPIRERGGSRLTHEELKQRISKAVIEAARVADKVILHIVDNTKTGVVAPDAEFVLALKKDFGKRLLVVVDACQFRLEKANLHRYLAHGFCVLITGSKFFTGPPFCGALLVPSQFDITGDHAPLPSGFSDYFTRNEVPEVLRSQAQHLSSALNFGLLFRWIGALKELKSFYSVASPDRTMILNTFRAGLISSIQENPDLDLIECEQPVRWHNADQTLWDTLPTIFSFAVKNRTSGNPDQWLSIGDLRTIYYLLNCDCGHKLPSSASEGDRQLASQRCHIGQPATIARCSQNGEIGALRIACGARLVYGIAHDLTLGKTSQERFDRELTDARTVLAKISLILRYWHHKES
ncbi:MAG: hypothetical protein H0X66_15230 [Verrucomicrobia bacterium]|nr:hypothetical protein [Verrucomicrobiota bacterium]